MEGRDLVSRFFLLAACAEDKEQKVQTEEFAKAASEAAGQIAQMPKLREARLSGLY